MAEPEIYLESVSGPIVHTIGAGNFGINSSGEPFYSYGVIPASERAYLSIEQPQLKPYVEKAPKLVGVEMEVAQHTVLGGPLPPKVVRRTRRLSPAQVVRARHRDRAPLDHRGRPGPRLKPVSVRRVTVPPLDHRGVPVR